MSKLSFLVLACLLAACSSHSEKEEASPLQFDKDEVVIDSTGPFYKRLKLETVTTGDKKFSLKVIGQIIALGNPSGELQGKDIVSWTELDPDLTRAAGLKLPTDNASLVGTAFGEASVPQEYAAQMKPGHPVEISHYGLGTSHVSGKIVSVRKRAGSEDSLEVVFVLNSASDWYPGLNCELRFPLFQVQSVTIPQTAILHEGSHEYVFAETQNSHFRLVPVVLADENQNKASVMGLAPDNKIVTDGAILLKPVIHHLLSAQEAPHAP